MCVFRTNVVSAAFLVTCIVEKAAEMTFVRKIHTFTIDEIDSREVKVGVKIWAVMILTCNSTQGCQDQKYKRPNIVISSFKKAKSSKIKKAKSGQKHFQKTKLRRLYL